MKTMVRRGIAALVLVLMTACDDSATEPGTNLDADDVAFLAVEADALAGALIFDLLGVGHVIRPADRADGEFERSRDCPAGGSMSIAGTVERTEHGDGAIEWTLEAQGDWDDCAHTRSRGDRAITTTIDGSFEIEANRKHNNRVPVGNQTTRKSGSFTWERSNGTETRTGECTFDVTSVRNPDSDRVTVTGTMCGREVDRTVSWRRGT